MLLNIKTTGEREINIKNLSKKLNVNVRRLYDIVNVMEGVGLMKKAKKNKKEYMDRKY